MGLFSGEDVYAFEVATAKMVNTDVDPLKDAILTAILVEEDIPSYILATMLNSISLKAKKYLDYGRNHYIYGLPEATGQAYYADPEKVEAAIEDDIGQPVTLLSAFATTPLISYFGYEYLQEHTNYSYKDNEVLLDGITFAVVDFTDNARLPPFYAPPTKIEINLIQTSPVIPPQVDPLERTILMDYPQEELYYQATYYLESETADDVRFWTYDPNLGTYPDLNYDIVPIESAYYPIAPLRIDKEWLKDDPDLEGEDDPYLTTTRLIKRVTLNLGDIIDAVEEEQDDDEIEALNDIFSLFALDLYTTVPESQEYFYLFFEQLHGIATVNQATYEAAVSIIETTQTLPPTNQFYVKEEQFTAGIEYGYMNKTIETGELENEFEKEIVYERHTTVTIKIPFFDPTQPDNPSYILKDVELENSYILVKKDNKDGTYTQYKMFAPRQVSQVQALGKTRNVLRVIDPDFIDPGDDDTWDKEGQSGFFFPVDYNIMNQLSFKDQMYALMDAMLLVIYAADKQHLEWYETGIFRSLLQFVMLVVNVVLFIPTLGSSLKLSAVLWKLFLAFAVPKLVNYIFELLIKHLGKDMAIFIIAAFFAFSLFKGLGNSLKGLPNALDILDVTKAITKGVGAATKIQGINQQFELDEMQKNEDELRDAQDLMDQDGYQPWYAIQAMIYTEPEEDPEDFYNRTIHLGNPGVLSLEMVNTFHDRALLLPDPGEVGRSIIV